MINMVSFNLYGSEIVVFQTRETRVQAIPVKAYRMAVSISRHNYQERYFNYDAFRRCGRPAFLRRGALNEISSFLVSGRQKMRMWL